MFILSDEDKEILEQNMYYNMFKNCPSITFTFTPERPSEQINPVQFDDFNWNDNFKNAYE